MKRLKQRIAGGILLLLGSLPAQASDFELMKTTYLTIYSVLEFIEMNQLIEDACRQADALGEPPGAYGRWRQAHAEALDGVMQIKALYEEKAIESGGERVRKAFQDQQMIVYSKAVKVTMPFYKGSPEQVRTACRNWTTTLDDVNSQFVAQANAEIASIVDRKDRIADAINNPDNW